METADRRPLVLITGVVSAVFHELQEWLQECAGGCVLHAANISQALRSLGEQPRLPDLLVVFQGHPGEYAAEDAAQLIGALPGRRVFCISSGWCASAARTHDVWPLACQIPIGSARTRLSHELQAWQQGIPAATPLLGAEELFSLLVSPTAAQADNAADLKVAVVSPNRALATSIAALLSPSATVTCHANATPLCDAVSSGEYQIVLIDEDDLTDQDSDLLLGLRSSDIQLVSFSGYPDCQCPAWADFRIDKSELPVQLPALSALIQRKRTLQ